MQYLYQNFLVWHEICNTNVMKIKFHLDRVFREPEDVIFYDISIPFICETGGAVYCPRGFFGESEERRGDYDVIFESAKISDFSKKIEPILLSKFKD